MTARPQRLSRARRAWGFVVVLVGLPALTALLVPLRDQLSLPSHLLLFLLGVVLVALVGGLEPAIAAAVLAPLLLNWYFTPPYGTLSIAQRDHLLALLVFVLVALAVAGVVELAAALAASAARAEADAQVSAALVDAAPRPDGLAEVLARLVETLALTSATVERREADGWSRLAEAHAADPAGGGTVARPVRREVPVGDAEDLRLVLVGRASFAEDRRILSRFSAAVGASVERARLADRAAEAARLEAADSLRTALLSAVGHDLRTPLAAVKAAVSGLRTPGLALRDEDRAELYATIEESTDQLTRVVANLLDLSRVEAGAVRVDAVPVRLEQVVDQAVDEAADAAGGLVVHRDLPEDVPLVRADAGLLVRVLANLLANAGTHGAGQPTVRARPAGDAAAPTVRLEVVDHGPGVDAGDRDRIFGAFQRLDDRGRGLGLGLAVARGLTEAMGGRIAVTGTPGGGLTVLVELPTAVRTDVAPEMGLR